MLLIFWPSSVHRFVLSHQLSPALKQSLAFKILKKDKKDQLLKFKNTFPIEIIKKTKVLKS